VESPEGETAIRITASEAETWGRINAEMESARLRSQNKALELQVAERDWVSKQRDLHAELLSLGKDLAGLQEKYKGVMRNLAKKYKVDLSQVAVDFDARLLYDLRDKE